MVTVVTHPLQHHGLVVRDAATRLVPVEENDRLVLVHPVLVNLRVIWSASVHASHWAKTRFAEVGLYLTMA